MADLDTLVARLNTEQQAAVKHDGNTVVLAGPGSGKTDTVVLKVAMLLHRQVAAPRGVACITYGNDAVREFSVRLGSLGLRTGYRLFLGTVHSFCLNRVLRPFAAISGRPELARPKVLSSAEQRSTLQSAIDECGLGEDPRYFDATLTRIRRAMACGEDLDPFDDRHVEAARVYEASLANKAAVDFESMPLEALRLIETDASIRELIVARYPWLVIDEYQDLGGPLHQIVLALESAGCRVFAVGDPDQCIFGFTGASPNYLNILSQHPSFRLIRLRFNYRSGARLIAAAEASLGARRGYEPDPDRTDAGEILFEEVAGGLSAQARRVVHDLVPQLVSEGTEPHEIAILYKGRGEFVDALVDEIPGGSQQYLLERDARFPTAPIVRWLQRCATRALGGVDSDDLTDLVAPYRGLLERAGKFDDVLATRCRLLAALDQAEPEDELHRWILAVEESLDLKDLIAADGSTPDDLDALASLDQIPSEPIALMDFAQGVQVRGRVPVTTCHSSKGRQFDVVILPALQTSLFPFARWDRGDYRSAPIQLAEERRLFYVGVTRARHRVVLVYSPSFRNRWGYKVEGRSPFVDEVAARLADGI